LCLEAIDISFTMTDKNPPLGMIGTVVVEASVVVVVVVSMEHVSMTCLRKSTDHQPLRGRNQKKKRRKCLHAVEGASKDLRGTMTKTKKTKTKTKTKTKPKMTTDAEVEMMIGKRIVAIGMTDDRLDAVIVMIDATIDAAIDATAINSG